jgi:6-phosphogluconolactonase
MQKIFTIALLGTSLIIQTVFCHNALAQEKKELFYIGTFSDNGSLGIYVYDFTRKSMRFDLQQTIFSQESPVSLAISPDRKYLYSANHGGLPDKKEWGSVSSFMISPETGKLSLIADKTSYGDGASHISVHPSGKYVFVSHYKTGNVVVLPVDAAGKFGEPTATIANEGKGTIMPQQSQSHPQSTVPSHDGKYLYVSDLGLDKIFIYEFNADNGTVKAAAQPFIRTIPGAGPRQFVFSADGKLAFSSEEMASSVCSYEVNKEDGGLRLIQRLPTLPPAYYGDNATADVQLAGDDKYVYVSNRGYNGLSIFKSLGNGKMKNLGYMATVGERPQTFLPESQGAFMLVGNRDSNEVNIFTIEKDGTLTDTSGYLPVPSSVCIISLELP